MTYALCSLCEEIAGRQPTPGGIIFDNGLWTVTHHRSPYTDPGELIVQTRRHCESMAEITPEEAAALGPVLHSAVRAVDRIVKPERVYISAHSERVLHVHFFVLPRTAELPSGHVLSDVYRRGRNLLRQWHLAPNPSLGAREAVAARMRAEWPR